MAAAARVRVPRQASPACAPRGPGTASTAPKARPRCAARTSSSPRRVPCWRWFALVLSRQTRSGRLPFASRVRPLRGFRKCDGAGGPIQRERRRHGLCRAAARGMAGGVARRAVAAGRRMRNSCNDPMGLSGGRYGRVGHGDVGGGARGPFRQIAQLPYATVWWSKRAGGARRCRRRAADAGDGGGAAPLRQIAQLPYATCGLRIAPTPPPPPSHKGRGSNE
jgi:hypothetical protein